MCSLGSAPVPSPHVSMRPEHRHRARVHLFSFSVAWLRSEHCTCLQEIVVPGIWSVEPACVRRRGGARGNAACGRRKRRSAGLLRAGRRRGRRAARRGARGLVGERRRAGSAGGRRRGAGRRPGRLLRGAPQRGACVWWRRSGPLGTQIQRGARMWKREPGPLGAHTQHAVLHCHAAARAQRGAPAAAAAPLLQRRRARRPAQAAGRVHRCSLQPASRRQAETLEHHSQQRVSGADGTGAAGAGGGCGAP